MASSGYDLTGVLDTLDLRLAPAADAELPVAFCETSEDTQEGSRRPVYNFKDLSEQHWKFINDGVRKEQTVRFNEAHRRFDSLKASLSSGEFVLEPSSPLRGALTVLEQLLHYRHLEIPSDNEALDLLTYVKNKGVQSRIDLPDDTPFETAKRFAEFMCMLMAGAEWFRAVQDENGKVSLYADFECLVFALSNLYMCSSVLSDLYASLIAYTRSLVELVLKLDGDIKDAADKAARKEAQLKRKLEKAEQRASDAAKKNSSEAACTETITKLESRVAELEEQLAEARAVKQVEAAPADSSELAGTVTEDIQTLIDNLTEATDQAFADLSKEKAEKERVAAEVEDLKEQLEAARAAHADAHRLKNEAYELANTHKQAAQAKHDALVVAELSEFPTSPLAALKLASETFSDTLAVADSAYESAEKFVAGNTNEVWQALRALATCGRELLLDVECYQGNVCAEFQNATGFELALKERSSVKEVERFGNMRKVTYDGVEYNIAPHLKGHKRKMGQSLRLHFAVDRERDRIVIGHCGEHLPTTGTARRGYSRT